MTDSKENPKNSVSQLTKRTHKITPDETSWLLHSLVTIGNIREIVTEFKKKFGKSVSTHWLYQMQNSDKYQESLERIRSQYDRELTKEYLTSPRKRISELTKIYEKACRNDDLKLASDQVMRIHEILVGNHKSGDTTINYYQQNNEYVNMTLEDIRKEQAKVLKRLENSMSGVVEISANQES